MKLQTTNDLWVFLLSGTIILLLLLWLMRLERKVGILLGSGDTDGSKTLGVVSAKSEEALRRIGHLERTAEVAEKRLARSIQGIETVRFNPFKEAGSGNQSFASAFISEEGNGVVISTLYSRDRVGVFGKPIVSFSSSFEMTNEEREAVARAAAKIQSGTKSAAKK